jgi:hypothetical protein
MRDAKRAREEGKRARDEGKRARDEGKRARDEAEKARDEAEKARDEAEKARDRVEKAKDKAKKDRHEAERTRDELARRRRRDVSLRVEAASPMDRAARRADEAARLADEAARRVDRGARRADEAARRADEAARHADEAARHADEAARRVDETARHEAGIADAAFAKANAAEDAAKALTPSLDLATDCLRLSMHFFHPIQHCAQQVYHTALPLSPTSSQLRNSCLQSVADDHLSRVTAFSGAPDTWGLLLRTINIRPKQLTCIATSAQRIVAACEDVVDIYDAVTFVLRQSLRAPETVTKILGSSDGSTLFFAHSYSVTMWDVQTGGLTHSFTTRSEITDIGISTTGDHIACGSSDGPVAFWNIHTKEEGKGFGGGQPVAVVHWISPQELVVGTHGVVYTRNIAIGTSLKNFSIFGRLQGMVYSPMGEGEFLVGTSKPGKGANQELFSLEIIKKTAGLPWKLSRRTTIERPQRMDTELLHPTLVGEEIACITPPSGVQLLDARSYNWTNNPPLLDAATSVAVSLNRNLVAQTKDSIQIFSLDVLKSGEARNDVRPSHIYPLGDRHIVCLLQPTRHLALLELETLRKLRPTDKTPPPWSLSENRSASTRASYSCGFIAEFGVSVVMEAWRSGTPLPEWTHPADEDPSLSGLSPKCTRIVTFHGSLQGELRVKDPKDGTILADLLLGDDHLGEGKVYDVTFDSETRFHLKIDGPRGHVQIPFDITPTPSGSRSHTITRGEPVPLSEPRATPPYALDANCEWVLDAESKRICWISPGNVRRGNGGHFWVGLSLVMVGDDGVVRKLSFREPDS